MKKSILLLNILLLGCAPIGDRSGWERCGLFGWCKLDPDTTTNFFKNQQKQSTFDKTDKTEK